MLLEYGYLLRYQSKYAGINPSPVKHEYNYLPWANSVDTEQLAPLLKAVWSGHTPFADKSLATNIAYITDTHWWILIIEELIY